MRYSLSLILALALTGCAHRRQPLQQNLPMLEIPKECLTGAVILDRCTELGTVDLSGHALPPKCKGSKITYKPGCEIIHLPGQAQ